MEPILSSAICTSGFLWNPCYTKQTSTFFRLNESCWVFFSKIMTCIFVTLKGGRSHIDHLRMKTASDHTEGRINVCGITNLVFWWCMIPIGRLESDSIFETDNGCDVVKVNRRFWNVFIKMKTCWQCLQVKQSRDQFTHSQIFCIYFTVDSRLTNNNVLNVLAFTNTSNRKNNVILKGLISDSPWRQHSVPCCKLHPSSGPPLLNPSISIHSALWVIQCSEKPEVRSEIVTLKPCILIIIF